MNVMSFLLLLPVFVLDRRPQVELLPTFDVGCCIGMSEPIIWNAGSCNVRCTQFGVPIGHCSSSLSVSDSNTKASHNKISYRFSIPIFCQNFVVTLQIALMDQDHDS